MNRVHEGLDTGEYRARGVSRGEKRAALIGGAAGLVAVGALAIWNPDVSITIDSYRTDATNVGCDEGRTRAYYADGVDTLSFTTHQDEVDRNMIIYVQRQGGGTFAVRAEGLVSQDSAPRVIGERNADGSDVPDFSISYGDAVWSIDVRPGVSPEATAVVASGVCEL